MPLDALLSRALDHIGARQWAAALACCDEALARHGPNAHAHHLAGYAAGQMGRADLALFHARMAVQLEPWQAVFRYNLAVELATQRRESEAAIQYQCCLRLDPDYRDALWNFGEMLRLAEHFELAASLLERFRAVGGNYPALDHRLAVCYGALGRDKEAEAAFARALRSTEPADELTHWEYALFLLSRERFAQGFAHYARRFLAGGRNSVYCHPFALPPWPGRFTPGGTLLIHGEQGLGDEMMFASVVPEVLAAAREAGCRVILAVKPALVRLFAASFADATVRTHRVGEAPIDLAEFGRIDWQLPIGDLAVLFRRGPEDFERARRPYLFSDARRARFYADWLAAMEPRAAPCGETAAPPRPVLKIGLAWGSNPAPVSEKFARWSAQRSIPVALLERMASLRPQVRFVSLQNVERGHEAALAPGLDIFDLSELQSDFFETAALVANMDIVISVDTSIAHLAGAMGKETWVPLMHRCDWRHGLAREHSYWYPHVRYFRQSASGDWGSVIDAMTGALRARLQQAHHAPGASFDLQAADFRPELERALMLLRQRDFRQAEPHFENALRISRDSYAVRWEYAMQLLTEGLSGSPDDEQADARLARGWDYYDARRDVFGWEKLHLCPLPWPLWRGEPLAGRTVVVHGEQGVGDEIMCASILPDLLATGARVIVACVPSLGALLRHSFPSLETVPHPRGRPQDWHGALPEWVRALAEAPGGVDYQIPMMSLGRYLRRKVADFPRRPYLETAPERVEAMARHLDEMCRARFPDAGKPKLRVGLAWCGSMGDDYARARSLKLPQLLPLARAGATDEIRFVSLQSRQFAWQIAEAPEFPLLDMSEHTDDFADLAALMTQLDLVISVDTSYAHLSAALGVPTWRLLVHHYDWRWGWARKESVWYACDRQFWQPQEGEWEPVIEAVAQELAALLNLRRCG